ncbi:MAG: helix-turn-helix domain-containing protein [Cyclobacteriaceae bacterium]
MIILNYIPLIGAILAFLLGILILFNKNQNKKARLTLGLIVFLNVHSLFEAYLFYNNLSWPGLGLSYLHYHLIGALFLLYTYFLFRIEVNLKVWIGVIIGYTLIRLAILAPIEDDILETATSFTPEVLGLTIDNLLSIFLNIGLLILAFLKIQKVHFAVQLTPREVVNYKWLKSLLIISIGLYIAILVSNISSIFDEDWLIYFKIESVFNSIFSLSLVYSGMRFPVFSVHGDFRDLGETTGGKYVKSSLNEKESNQIWEDITSVMADEKPYLNFEYRLNDLAERVGRSVHHVSQTINEKEGISFSDLINQFRVNEAKALLSAGRAKKVTILAVSLESGFNSKTAFYNTFKKITGQTPSDFVKEQTS